jgi:pimeloyl-ACP methyl ester carboxylesterase
MALPTLLSIAPAGAVPLVPSDVPSVVDDALLVATLRAGRPAGEPGLLEVDGVRTPTVTAGQGRATLCVHGLGHDAWDFAPLMARCQHKLRLTAMDLPGFGLSDKPARTWDLEVLVQAVLHAAAAQPEPPLVVASSLGGHVALLAALRAPTAFSGLVLLAPGGLVDLPPAGQDIARRYYSVDAISTRKEDEVVRNSHRIFPDHGLVLDDQLAARKLAVRRSQRQREFAVPFAGVVDDVFRHLVRDRIDAIRVPTLMITGVLDAVVSPTACAEAARRMRWPLRTLSGVGHCPHLEVPDTVAEAVLSFANA